jgi:hypothetical protein
MERSLYILAPAAIAMTLVCAPNAHGLSVTLDAAMADDGSRHTFDWLMVHLASKDFRGTASRPTFADSSNLRVNMNDVGPIVQGNPPVTRGMKIRLGTKNTLEEVPLTFQVRPTLQECRPDVAQTPHNGMVSGFGDGSVRILSGGMAPAVFWAATTPSGGEVIQID